jgi:chromatin remodeling complex protein RSC6
MAAAPTSATMCATGWFRSRGKIADFLSVTALQSAKLCALSTGRNNRRAMMAQGARKAGGGLARPVTPSADLAQICGSQPLPRSQVVSKVWDHIRKNNLQNPQNKREILADDKLKKVFGGKDRVSMFEMNKHLSNHLK